MNNIKQLASILPIVYDNRKLKLLSTSEIYDYSSELRSNYFNKYSDYNYKTDLPKSNLQSILFNFAVGYSLKLEYPGEARLILIDNANSRLIGGCTIFEKENNTVLELAYFIKPEYQHKGEALNMLRHVIQALRNSKINFYLFRAIIQDSNEASIKLVDKLGFKPGRTFKGVHTYNIVCELVR